MKYVIQKTKQKEMFPGRKRAVEHVYSFETEKPVCILAQTNYISAADGYIEIDMKDDFELVHHKGDNSEEMRKRAENDRINGYRFACDNDISWEDYYAALDTWERKTKDRVEIVRTKPEE